MGEILGDEEFEGCSEITELLDETEVRALRRRTRRLLDAGILPIDTTGRAWPWPLV